MQCTYLYLYAIRHGRYSFYALPSCLFCFAFSDEEKGSISLIPANLASIQYLHVRDIFPDQCTSDQVALFMTLNEAINITSVF